METSGTPMEADRVLASIVKILNLTPILGADNVILAQVLGWEVVVKKEEFKVGDLAIYFSIDSILETNPNTEFLANKPLKTRKIRGVLSQGLVAPLEWLIPYNVDPSTVKEGDDVTTIMNVKKWIPKDEEEVYNYSKATDTSKSNYPEYIPKTNEERVQNISNEIEYFKDKNVVITQKFDGTSATYVFKDGNFMVCGRNFTLLENTGKGVSHYFEIASRYNLEENFSTNFKHLGRSLAIQGEIIGPKINANRHKVDKIEYYVFNIFDIKERIYYPHSEVENICNLLGLKMVKLVYKGPMKEEWLSVKELLAQSDLQRYESGEICEGIVLKTDLDLGVRGRRSCKIISNNFLLKYKL